MKELDEREKYFHWSYNSQLANSIKLALHYYFPGIKGLKVIATSDNKLKLTFDEGKYTKEEVQDKLEEIRNTYKNE